MPLLLPSIAFVISIFIILQMGITPIQDYRGTNNRDTYLYEDTEIRFIVYEPGIAYVRDTNVLIHSDLYPEQSIDIILDFYLHGDLIETLNVNLTAGENESLVSYEKTLSLNPGLYIIDADFTFYDEGVIMQGYGAARVILSQETLSSIYPELIDWSTYKFTIIIGSFFFVLGGICIGKEDIKERRTDDYDQEPSRAREYRSYDL